MTIISQLNALEMSGLIRLVQAQPELEYLFRHALVQDTAYGSLLKQDRKRLHLAVGTVALPAVFKVTLKFLLPLTNAALAGTTAFTSLELIATVSLVLIKFQLASTALTVATKAVPAVCGTGVPVFPVGVPGAAVSPGSKI